jgi:hypothetical protein
VRANWAGGGGGRLPEGGLTFSQRRGLRPLIHTASRAGAPRLRCAGTGVSCRLRGPPWRSHARWRSASLGSSLPVTPVGVLAVDAVLAPPTATAGQQGRRASSTSRSWPAPAVSCGCVAGGGGSG